MAWTGNFKDQIDDLAGTLVSADDAAIQQWLRDGCYDVLQKAIAKHGADELWKFTAKSTDQTSNGFDIDEIRTIAAVLRNDVYATKGKRELNHKYKDAASIYSPTDNTPIWIIDNDQIYVWPAPTPSAPANYFYIPEYVLTNWNTGTASIDIFPSEYYYYVMLYGAIKVLNRKMLDFNITTSPTFDSLPVTPDSPNIAGITYSTTTNSAIVAPTISTTAYVSPTALAAFVNSFTIPSANITAPNITAEGVASVSKPDISGDIPKYNSNNTIIGFGDGAGQQFAALAGKTITDLSVTSVTPDTPAISAISYSPAGAIDIDSVADISVTNMSVSDMVAVADESASTSSQASTSPPVFTAPDVMGDGNTLLSEMEGGTIAGEGVGVPDPEKWFSILGQMIEDEEDIELASSQMQKISTFINAYQVDVQNSLNVFNADNAEYSTLVSESTSNIQAQNQIAIQNMQKDLNIAQANLNKNQSVAQANLNKDTQVEQTNQQKDLERARVKAANAQAKSLQDAIQESQALVADNNAKLQKYQAELSVYQAEVNTEIQEHTQNSSTELQLWQNQQQHLMQQHNQQVQEAINIFNAENAKYQANIQAETQHAQTLSAEYQKEADIAMQAKIQDYTFELQEWSQELQRYQMHVGNEVQAYQQTLARYQAEQNDSVQAANIANQAHLQQAQLDLQSAIRNGDKDMELAIQNSLNTMQAAIQDNTQIITKYQAELSTYQAELTAYQADSSNKLQKYQADIQAQTVDYQWLQDQYSKLTREYEMVFAIPQVEQQ